MTRNEFDAIKRNITTLEDQLKLTGEIPKPFEGRKYADKEYQRIFNIGVSCGLHIALNILAHAIDSTRDDIVKARYLGIMEEL